RAAGVFDRREWGALLAGAAIASRAFQHVKIFNGELKATPRAFSIPPIAGGAHDRLSVHFMDAIKPDLLDIVGKRRFGAILADPPWRFINKTGKVAPEHRRLSRYGTMTLAEIMALPVEQLAAPTAHLYLWCPNALLPDGLAVMQAWGFGYKSNIV